MDELIFEIADALDIDVYDVRRIVEWLDEGDFLDDQAIFDWESS